MIPHLCPQGSESKVVSFKDALLKTPKTPKKTKLFDAFSFLQSLEKPPACRVT